MASPFEAPTVKNLDTLRGITRSMFLGVGAISVLLLATWLNTTLRSLDPPMVQPPEQISQSLSVEAARFLSFGHAPALVDALVIRGISDPAYDPVLPGERAPLFYLMDLATRLDPFQFELYWISASLLSIVRRDGEGAALLLERAHELLRSDGFPEAGFQERYWNHAWQLEMMRGYNALFELQNVVVAQDAFEAASRLPRALSFLSALSRRLATREGRIEVAERTLDSLLRRKNDPAIGQALEERQREVRLARYLFDLESAFQRQRSSRPGESQRAWASFLESRGTRADPEGGTLSWDESLGRVKTSTPLGRLGRLYLD